MFVGIGVGIGINRSNYAQGIFSAYQSRVIADGGVTEAGTCVDAVSGLLLTASLLLIPSGYKSGKVYAEIPTNGNGDLTWTRASNATRANSSGLLESMGSGVPRLDYTYGSCPALLLEPQRTNSVLRSEEFNLTWTSIRLSVTPNTTIGPDGNTTADSLIENTATASRVLRQSVITTASSYTFSVYAKANTRSWIYLSNTITGSTYFDLSNGTIGFTPVGVTASITNVGNGWYRCATVFTATNASNPFDIGLSTGNLISSYTGNGVSGVYIWGAQVEAGAYPTTYIPTTTASATRVADVATKTGISSLIGQSEGTIFIQFSGRSTSTNSRVITITGGSKEFLLFFEPAGTGNLGIFSTNTGLFYIDTGGANNKMYKIAFAYEANNYALYVNGVSRSITQSANTFSSLSRIDLNQRENGSEIGLTVVNQLVLFTSRLTNAELASLTTL